ncbi:MAG: hydrogenase subunit MbhD domain-containing protein [Bacillota bacterium]
MGNTLSFMLLIFLIVAAISVARTRDLVSAVIIFAAYGLAMAIIWQMLRAPDIAITEAAIGAGLTSLLFLAAIARTQRYER